MKIENGKLFLITALILLVCAASFGLLSATTYLFPYFLKEELGFSSLRPLHVSLAIFWIILGATGCVYYGIEEYTEKKCNPTISFLQWVLWIIAILGIMNNYFTKDFEGREYWEFRTEWVFPILIAWLLFMYNTIPLLKSIKKWPVYFWMWFTGILFFLFTFLENYLWTIPYFRENIIIDMTIQWKVNGSLVGSWNQILYGTAFFLMDKNDDKKTIGGSKLAFSMYFLGLFNLMFNWGHHIYTLPTENYIRYIGYFVSMTEWVFFIKIVWNWRKEIKSIKNLNRSYSYKFIAATNVWVFLNMGQAILMSIPAVNLYTHGTHVTVAHAMGTTIGINSMILLSTCFTYLYNSKQSTIPNNMHLAFWLLQVSLFIFWITLNWAGITKGIWQLSIEPIQFSEMMNGLRPQFQIIYLSGIGLFIAILLLAYSILRKKKIR
ncbi:MAG: cbb3-type cytochrome c oxidase subunit I [Bacteroidetes bacterium]|nr:cbb3-type cytochrome c oxidase subunit I [Bacteroidota bacterium]